MIDVDTLLSAARDEDRSILLEPEGYALLAAAGMSVPVFTVVETAGAVDDATLDNLSTTEVVLKVVSPDVLHKSDVGGVKVVACETQSVREGVATMLDRVATAMPDADLRGVMIVERVDFVADAPGTELLLSARVDEAFGPMLAAGPGGVLTEWYGKLSDGSSHTVLGAGLGKGTFDAARGAEILEGTVFGAQALKPSRRFDAAPFDRGALTDALKALACLIETKDEDGHPVFDEIELNPVVAVDGRPVALDALIRRAATRGAGRPPRPIHKVGNLLHPKSAVVYGASANAMNAGRIILRNLKAGEGLDYGRLWAVHPKADRIDGVPCVESTAKIPEDVDLAVIAIPADKAARAIEEIATSGKAKSIILIPGGFAETEWEPEGEPPPPLDLVGRIAQLRDAMPFAGAKMEALADLARDVREARLEAGHPLWREGEASDAFYFLLHGTVDAESEDGMRMTFGPGDVVGSLGTLGAEPRWFSATAASEVVALRLEAETLLDVMEDHFDFAMALVRSMARGFLSLLERAQPEP